MERKKPNEVIVGLACGVDGTRTRLDGRNPRKTSHVFPAASDSGSAKCPESRSASDWVAIGATPRESLVRNLAARLVEAVDVRDLGAARVAHEALGKLLEGAEPSDVVDLARERKRRSR
jgi:hypothetical protein